MKRNLTSIKIISNFPGSNPQDPDNIIRLDENCFKVMPECEINQYPAYKFRMDIKAVNNSENQNEITLKLDWKEDTYNHLRRILYLSDNKNNWRPFEGVMEDGLIIFKLKINPGTTDISFQPRYDIEQLNNLLLKTKNIQFIDIQNINTDNYPIYSFSIKKNTNLNRPTILAAGRIHPYESAGSYCLDGLLCKIIDSKKFRKQILDKFDLIIIPVLSMNGVLNGCCRLNGNLKDSIDLARQWSDMDYCCKAIKKIASEHHIAGYLEIHNWMLPELDGIQNLSFINTIRFIRSMRQLTGFNNKWKKMFHKKIFKSKYTGVKKWLGDNHGIECLLVEYPWCNRDVEIMKELGCSTLLAFSKII